MGCCKVNAQRISEAYLFRFLHIIQNNAFVYLENMMKLLYRHPRFLSRNTFHKLQDLRYC